MSMNTAISAQRLHIAFFGLRNAGKSSLVNAVTGQKLSVVSPVKGTTTDPVKKSMELLPLGPVVIIDTPGMDDEGELGALRVEKARQILNQTDIAVLVADATLGLQPADEALLALFRERRLPFLIALNKADLLASRPAPAPSCHYVSAVTGEGVHTFREALGQFAVREEKLLASDLFDPGDTVILVTPIDEAAPKGRLILPQQLVLRDILDHHGMAMVCQDSDLPAALSGLSKPPRLVITDSQVFGKVSAIVPESVPLTSFSILMARHKGELRTQIRGAAALSRLRDGDRVLICEGCTHHRQCNDIGTVKIPGWIEKYAGVKPDFRFTSGGEFPEDLSGYALVVHCGGCMLNEAQMRYRVGACEAAGIPIVNYGIAIACMHGILRRSLAPIPGMTRLL